jgi:hypothetical protein
VSVTTVPAGKFALQGPTGLYRAVVQLIPAGLIKRHYNMCLKRASSFIRNPTDVKMKFRMPAGKPSNDYLSFGATEPSAWLSRIVENRCPMRIREDRRARFLYLDDSTRQMSALN